MIYDLVTKYVDDTINNKKDIIKYGDSTGHDFIILLISINF